MTDSYRKVRVLVADDSAFMRRVLTDIINSDSQLEVIGTARNGEEAYRKALVLHPDVVTLDVEMPVMDGLAALERILEKKDLPVIMLSALTHDGATATLQALERGAVDFIAKPGGSISINIAQSSQEIINKIKTATQIPAGRFGRKIPLQAGKPPVLHWPKTGLTLVAIGTSTGGPKALHEVMSNLPGNIPAALFITQHMPPGFTRSLAQRLDTVSSLRVKEAEEGEEVRKGWAYVAPGDYHMVIEEKGGKLSIRLPQTVAVNGHRPSVDVMFNSLAGLPYPKIIVLMTGMGSDGARGMKALKESGAITIAESADSCIVYGMPRVAVQLGVVDYEVPLNQIAGNILQALRNQ